MKDKKRYVIILTALAMLFVVLDAKTAIQGGQDGIMLCLRTVIPSLFPFIFLSGIIVNYAEQFSLPFLRPVCKLLGIPKGNESLLFISIIGGYPIGAQAIYTAYKNGNLSRENAHRLLGFCNNAGPAFIFGMGAVLFPTPLLCWVAWGIHIVSALLVGTFLPHKHYELSQSSIKQLKSIPKILEESVKTMGIISGWVILFRVLIFILNRWVLWVLPAEISLWIIGILELTNGCSYIQAIPDTAWKFIIFCTLLGFGGICVGIQTKSVTRELNTGLYFPGKLLQGLLSFLFSFLIFYWNRLPVSPVLFPVILAAVIIALLIKRNRGSILSKNSI